MKARVIGKIFWIMVAGFVVCAGALGTLAWYGHKKIVELSKQISDLQIELVATTNVLKAEIATTSSAFENALTIERKNIEDKFGSVEERVGSISGTVGTLEKLSKTDPELLNKYSKVYFLNEHYSPERVVQIPGAYTYSQTRIESIHALVWPHLQEMLDAAKAAGVALFVKSAYRPYDEQKALKGAYTVTYGAGTANQFSADQGYSEHQLGTTADFISTGQGGVLDGFDKTAAFAWMQANAYKSGFILSYPKNNAYYIYEPWHWRYVGVKLATYLQTSGKNFYDLDQREIDTYLINLF